MSMKMCLNWKVVGGLVAVALGVWALAPSIAGAVLPVLVLAACPLSMLVMMWVMRRGMGDEQRAMQPHASPAKRGTSNVDQRLVELNASLADVQSHHQAIMSEIAQLEAANAAADEEHRDTVGVTTAQRPGG